MVLKRRLSELRGQNRKKISGNKCDLVRRASEMSTSRHSRCTVSTNGRSSATTLFNQRYLLPGGVNNTTRQPTPSVVWYRQHYHSSTNAICCLVPSTPQFFNQRHLLLGGVNTTTLPPTPSITWWPQHRHTTTNAIYCLVAELPRGQFVCCSADDPDQLSLIFIAIVLQPRRNSFPDEHTGTLLEHQYHPLASD